MEQLDLINQSEQKHTWDRPRGRTDAPAVIGTWISKTMIRAVKTVASGTRFVGEHRTLPMLRLTGSTSIKLRVTLKPAAAQGAYSSSISIAKRYSIRGG